MKLANTRAAASVIGYGVGGFVGIAAWTAFSYWIAGKDHFIVGVAISFTPLIVIPLAIALYKDLRA